VRLRSASVAACLVLAAACTQEPEFDLPTVALTPRTTSPTAGPSTDSSPAAALAGAPGRLVVIDELGNLATMDPDGSDASLLAEVVTDETVVRQPTWSPDGRRIAWVRFDAGGAGPNAIVTRPTDGTTPTEIATEVVPFYLSWDPTSSRIAFLGSTSTAGIELGVVDVAAGGEAVALDAGQPLYFSWDPSGEELFVHADRERLDRLGIDGTATPVGDRPGTFDTPVWTSDGRSLVYASTEREGQRLVAHDLESGRGRSLVRFDRDGGITFVVGPDGSRVAYQVLRSPDEVAPLEVLDRGTGAVEQVVDAIVPAYFWSPDGTKLLYLVVDGATDRTWFRWGVWDGTSSSMSSRFAPSDVFGRDYLQFFQQYAQSMSLWAPDGSAFVYAGTAETGDAGIWIQPARAGSEPILVSGGVFAAWSAA
jgi:TolB protein